MSEPDFIKQFNTVAQGYERNDLVGEIVREMKALGGTWFEAEVVGPDDVPIRAPVTIIVRGWRVRPALTAGEIKPEGE